MDNSTLISVIVAIYNVSEYLPVCLESIIKQTYRNLEIILVDDGSTDKSGDICDKYKCIDDRIIVIHKKNEGLVRARKEGLKVAKGQFIALVDGDDYIDSEMYEEMVCTAKSMEVDIVNSGIKMSNSIKMLSPGFNLKANCYNKVEIIKHYLLDLDIDNRISHNLCNKLFKENIIKKSYQLVPDSQSFGEDWLCFSACICENAGVVSLNKAYYNYNIRNDSLSHKYSIESYTHTIQLYNAFVELFRRYGIYEELKKDLDHMLKYLIIDALKKSDTQAIVQKYKVPNVEKLRGKRIIIYGAGVVGNDYYAYLSRFEDIQIVAWVDAKYYEKKYEYCKVREVSTINIAKFDYVIIANLDKGVIKDMLECLKENGVSEDKIICTLPILA